MSGRTALSESGPPGSGRRRFWRTGTAIGSVAVACAALTTAAVLANTSADAKTAPAGSPVGAVQHFFKVPGGVWASGWMLDPSGRHDAIVAYALVDGRRTDRVVAARSNPASRAHYPYSGTHHGFGLAVRLSQGRHTICIKARNVGPGRSVALTCRIRVINDNPLGRIDSVGTVPGALHVRGWALDYDKPTGAVPTTITVDGKAHAVTANRSRPDVAKARENVGALHGFDATYAVAQGRHTVCVSLKNVGYGRSASLGCKTVTLDDSPRGAVDTLARSGSKLRLRGWVYDRDQPTGAVRLSLKIDSALPRSVVANVSRPDVAKAHPSAGQYHGFDELLSLSEGKHQLCLTARNIGFGANVALVCRSVTINYTPSAAVTTLKATSRGVAVYGWAKDPDTTKPTTVRITVDGHLKTTQPAKSRGTTHTGYNFAASLLLGSGKHTVCAVGVNVLYGHADSTPSCRTLTLALVPIGKFEKLARVKGSNNLAVTGWAFDPDTTASISVVATLDGTSHTLPASAVRSDVARVYPGAGSAHGIAATLTANAGEHTVCLTARNVSGGANRSLGCRLIIAVHPKAPSTPRSVHAHGGYASATVTWQAPASDGGAPWTRYTITASPGGRTVTAAPTARSATVTGLKAKTSYVFTVRASNVAGTSPRAVSAAARTQAGPPPQRTPAPVSTSRYIRNIRGASATDLAVMRREGVADAKANPSGHRYLALLDIGGQDYYDGGAVLSATTRFVSYANLVRDLKAYLDGYHSAQRATAPVTVAVGTNNDMDVSAGSGRAWADKVVDPLVSYARRYSGIAIAGANDIEPGFRGTYTQTRRWLTGFLGATHAPFIFNGSADGCAWTVTNRGCNNGWSMAGLYNLAAGLSPSRMQNLPQVYNYTMADQWKFISLTGIAKGNPRIRFGGPLTEWTACAQARSCGSISGHSAWARMWRNLQSDSRLRVTSLPYATDLRIDR